MPPLRQTSLLFLLRRGEVLLARKKHGFGKGKVVGVGGHRQTGESLEQAAVRETIEEIGVIPEELLLTARLTFHFAPPGSNWNMRTVAFTTTSWRGTPRESEEVAPIWYRLDHLPYEEMWEDARHWLPRILAGEMLEASFTYDEAFELQDYRLREVSLLG